MSPATLEFKTALADARADREGSSVVCYIANGRVAARSQAAGRSERQGQQTVQAIVRLDEPVLYCGWFPAWCGGTARWHAASGEAGAACSSDGSLQPVERLFQRAYPCVRVGQQLAQELFLVGRLMRAGPPGHLVLARRTGSLATLQMFDRSDNSHHGPPA